MKKSLSIALSLVIGLGFTLQSYAASVTHYGTVSRIYIQSSGHINFQLNQSFGCDLVHSNHYYRINSEATAYDQDYALLLGAAHSGKVIRVRIDDAACSENIVYSDVLYLIQDF